ncbi:hypothetical protein PIB30_078523 [Stylosanthes scabra]|uniref:Putative plant transposon protein domain-containing protein n=1 Tax=Stylosanthes scabra TaxID=79078 RepID=A0ABU6UTM5_9FABA|nr:hypothetical protein [Stylosanthes scabra]
MRGSSTPMRGWMMHGATLKDSSVGLAWMHAGQDVSWNVSLLARVDFPCICVDFPRLCVVRRGKGATHIKMLMHQLQNLQYCLRTSKSSSLEGQYPEISEQISLRRWRRLSKPRTKISKALVHKFYANAVRTEEELASGEDYPYTSFVRGKEVDFSAAKIREVLRIRVLKQISKQGKWRIKDICMLGARWKISSSQPPHPIQLRRQDLTPVARGWAEFIIHSMIHTGNKSKITVARAVLIHSIIKGHDVKVEELIADNIAVLAEEVQGRSKLCFPSTIYRLCKEARVPMGEFKDGEKIQIAKPITAKVMTTIRGRIINQPQNQPMEDDEDENDAENRFANHDQDQKMHFEAAGAEEDHHQYHDQPHFEAYESNFQQYKEDQNKDFNF